MRVLRGVVYMLKRIGPMTEPWSMKGDVKPEARTEKGQDDK